MTRAIGFTALNLEGGKVLAPQVEVTWSDRYLGARTIRPAGAADDLLPADRCAICYRSGELLQLKSSGTSIQFQARDAATLAVTLAWRTVFTTSVSGCPVALIQSGSDTLAIWPATSTRVDWARSTDGGRTWGLGTALRVAVAGNTLGSILQAQTGMVAVEERVAAGTAKLSTYSYSAGAWSLVDTHDTGGTQVLGGGIQNEGDTTLVYAVDGPQTTMLGTVTVRYVRVYDLVSHALRGTLHQGVAG